MAAKKNMLMWIVLGVVAVIIILGLLMFLRGGKGPTTNTPGVGSGEDTWIKDSRGVWVRHGNPATTPDYVIEQENLITCANRLYFEWQKANVQFNSQCLGQCLNKYAVDLVHVPRTAADDLAANQCKDYLSGLYPNFIELDPQGNLVRIG